jgi:hypothetical protein
MAIELTYTVENASMVTQEIDTTYEGQPAKISVSRAVIECLPEDPAGRTLTLSLPAADLPDYPEGAKVKVTVLAEEI